MEIRLSSSTGPWSCKISIRYEFDGEGQRLADVLEVPCFSSSIPKSGVEHAIRVAQTIVLDPVLALEGDELFLFLLNPELLLLLSTLKNTTPKGLQFSRNIICVDLEGPELPDLSFIDLPGKFISVGFEVMNSQCCRIDTERGARHRGIGRRSRRLPHWWTMSHSSIATHDWYVNNISYAGLR